MGRVVLVQTSDALPGLFPFHSWEALSDASVVWARDPDTHPSAAYLGLAEVPLARLEPSDASMVGADLLRPGSPEDRRYAKALLGLAEERGAAVYLLGPEDGETFTRTVGLEATDRGAEVEFVFHQEPPGTAVLRLAEVERALRDPAAGCPWDLEQDHASLGRYLVEETYELLDAISSGDDHAIAEELGDVLLQVVFHAQIAADRTAFDLDDVATGIADKLVRRHPHVFADVEVADAAEVKANWEVLKQEEKGRTGPFEGVPLAMPALHLADKLQRRAAKLGVDEHPDAAEDVVRDVERSVDGDDPHRHVGELLSAAVALARSLDVDPEQALRDACERFRRRVEEGGD